MNEIKACFERIVGALEKDPSRGRGTGKTVARVGAGLACEIESGPWRFRADMPKTAGGTATPGMYGRAALGSCLAIGYAMRAAHANVKIDAVEVEVQADYDDGSAPEADVLRVLDDADRHSPYLDVFRRAQRCVRSVEMHA